MNRLSCSQPALPQLSRMNAPVFRRVILVCAFTVGCLYAGPTVHADAPSWMHALVNAPVPPHDEKTEAIVLYTEEILTVQPNGKLKETDRFVYKILRPTAKYLAKVKVNFDGETHINHIHGWCIPAQGKDYEVKDKDVGEDGLIGLQNGELFSDHRVKVMEIPAADPGNIIGFEYEHERRPYILQDEFGFQESFPIALARYTLQLPQGWEYKAVWINHPEVAPTTSGSNQFTWELRDIPEIKPEESMPPWRGIVAMLLVALIPPGGTAHGFLTWSEMGLWQKGLLQGRLATSPEIKQKVAELTANKKTTLTKIQALSSFVQTDVRYVGIWLGIGGWQPHPASDVFANRYGDCKDKAALLSVMLKEIGVDSYYVLIDSERGAVTPTIAPHLGLFDHVILAMHIPEDINDLRLMATIQDPKLGRLLIFDPTDELTPLGSLHGDLQASYALLVTPDGGELTQMPQLPSASSGVRRTAKLTLSANGALRGDVEDERYGDAAWWQRGELRNVEKSSDRIKPVERLMARSVSSFQITKASITNLNEFSEPFLYRWSFVAQDYAKLAGNLLLVRPRVLGVETSGLLETKEPRKYAIEFPGPRHDTDAFEIAIPDGYVVDDLPPPTDADYPFGSYHSKTVADGKVLKYTRTYEIKQLSVPVSQAEDLKKFYRIIGNDERGTAVLKPK